MCKPRHVYVLSLSAYRVVGGRYLLQDVYLCRRPPFSDVPGLVGCWPAWSWGEGRQLETPVIMGYSLGHARDANYNYIRCCHVPRATALPGS